MQDITELRQSEDELSEIKERFRVLAESSLTGIYLTEQDRFTYVNPALAKMFGYEVEEVVGRLGSTDLTCPDDRSLVAENMRRRLQGDVEEMRYEFRGLRKDGSVFPVEVHGRRIEHGGRIGVLGTLIDNTERKRAEDELRESEARFRKLTDLSSRLVLEAGREPAVHANRRREGRILDAGFPGQDPVGAARHAALGLMGRAPRGARRPPAVPRLPVLAHRPRRRYALHQRERRAGVRRAGRVQGLRRRGSDITPRKRAEEALRASEARFRTFVDHATDAFFLLDEQLVVVDVNRQACESLGWSREELIGMHPREFDVGLDEPSISGSRSAPAQGRSLPSRRAIGARTALRSRSRSAARTFKQGGDLFYLALARDISERKLAEESLRQSEAYLAEAQRLSHTGSWALDVASNRYVYTSEESDRIFGFDPQGETPTREAVFERMHPEDRSSWKRNLEKSLREKVDTFDQYRIVLPDGRVRHIHTIRHPVVNSAGEVVKLVGTSIDITERKRAEEEHERLRRLEAELAHANRVNTLGELTTSIAHEVSQPLGAMVASAGACARWLAADPPAMAEARSALDNIVADGKRAREVIGRIRALTKRQVPRMDLLDLNRKILEVLAFTEQELRSHDIVLETRLDSDAAAGDGRSSAAAAGASQPDRERDRGDERRARSPARVDDRFTAEGTTPWWSRYAIPASGSTRSVRSECSRRSTRPRPKASASACRSAARSSRRTVGGSGRAPNEPHGAVFRFSLPVAEGRQS